MSSESNQRKRTAFLSVTELPIQKAPIHVSGFNKDGSFVCRLEINRAGVEIFGGLRGKQQLANLSWEGLVDAVVRAEKQKE